LGENAMISAVAQDSFSLIYLFDHLPAHEFWSDEGHTNVADLPRGSVHIMDLRPSGNARFRSAFDTMNVALPRRALVALGEQLGVTAPEVLRTPRAWDWQDRIVGGLQVCLAEAIQAGPDVDNLVVDRLLLALMTHVAVTYGEMRAPSSSLTGPLSPQQVKRAQHAMADDLENGVSIADVARLCDVSPAHFSRAFKAATGATPSAWRLARRIDLAKNLLANGNHSLADVAVRTGFADQSHFTRVFAREVGSPPRTWKRTRGHK